MRCASYATADGYDLKKISDYLTTMGNILQFYAGEVIHTNIRIEDEEGHDSTLNVFIFSYGCLIIWGGSLYQEKLIIKKFSKYANKPLDKPLDDVCEYVPHTAETSIDEENDRIAIADNDLAESMISFSYGLSQSVKLSLFEESVSQTISTTKTIPLELIKNGRISLSRKELTTKMGSLFAVRNLINLHSDLLDTPEFFWRRPKCEPYYMMSVEFLDIKTRTEILNKRLDVIHNLYEMISNQLQHNHASRLELIIIYLIMFEVAIAVLHDILGWI